MKTIVNFRDISGYKTPDGKRLKNGFVYRSGNLDNAFGSDVKQVLAYGIKKIIDLRQDHEIKRLNGKLNAIKRVFIPFNITETTKSRLKPFMNKRHDVENNIIEAIKSVYLDMVEGHKAEIAEVLRNLITAEDYPVLINCHLGKDRTGFVCAILMLSLGFDSDAVVKEYIKTNDLLLPRTRTYFGMMKILSFGAFPAKNYKTASIACAVYIQTVIEKIKKEYGCISNYLSNCGIKEIEIVTLKNILLEN